MNTDQLAVELFQAYKNHKEIEMFGKRDIHIDVDSAYKIQELLTKMKIQGNNEKIIGYKISMTSEETQKPVNTDSPAYGIFTSTNLVEDVIQLGNMKTPLIEPELVFIINEDLSIGAGPQEVVQKCKISAGLEIPDSRYKQWFPPAEGANVGDYIADNACGGSIAIGEPKDIPQTIDWERIKGILYFNDEKLDEGYSSVVLGNPVNAVCWLTEKLAQNNRSLKKGEFVSAGTFTLPKPLEKGVYRVVFDIVGELSIKVEQ